MKTLYFLLIFALLLVSNMCLNAATITSTLTGNWSNLSTWNSTVIPGPGDDVIISGGKSVTVNGNYTCNSITIGSAANNANTLLISGSFSLTVTNTITIVPPNGGTNNNVLDVASGFVSCTGLGSTDSGNNTRDCNIAISTGTLDVNGNAVLGPNTSRNAFTFSGAGLFRVSGTFTGGGTFTLNSGNFEYYGAAQTLHSSIPTYNDLILSGSGTKTMVSSLVINGSLFIKGTSQLDVTATPYNISLAKNLSVTSTNADPFVEQTGKVTLNGSAGTQTISTVLAGGESFYKLAVANTSSSNPAIIFSNNVTVNEDYDQSAGFIDIKGNNFTCIGANSGAQTFSLSNSGIISSVAGSTVSISQGSNPLTVYYNRFQIGNATNGITTNMTSDLSEWIFSTFYGPTNFIKTGATENIFGGGNTFYGPCAFTTMAGASRWRMGDDGAGTSTADTYYNGTFTHNGSSNFILACNSTGTQFYGTTTLNSTTTGGLYVTRQNGTAGSWNATMNGPVIVNVSLTGSVYFADATTNFNNTVTFNNTIQVNSLSSSTGDIYFGDNAQSTVILSNTAQFIAGSIAGLTSVRLQNLTQNGTLLQTISGSTNSKLFCGTTTIPCTFNGPVSFNMDTLDIRSSTFNNNVTFIGNSQHNLSANTFNGTTNSFTKNGSANNSATGGNIFAAGSTSAFTSNGTGYWRLGNTNPDDFNGDVTYVQAGSGLLQPTYNSNSTYAGNISTAGTSTAIDFGTSTSGRVTIDGNTAQTISGSSSQKPVIRRLTMANSSGGSLTLNVPVDISVSLTNTNGIINTTSTNSLTLTDETVVSSVGNANSYVNGPMAFVVTSNAAQVLNFPLGKGGAWRPITLSPRNSVSTAITYKAESFNSSARTFSWTVPATVSHVSDVSYWDVDRTLTSTGAALPTQSLTGNQAITLYYLTSDVVTDPTNLVICKNTSTATTTWINIGGSGASAGAGNVTSTSAPTAFTSYSRFTLGNKVGGSNPLPIELVNFTAVKNNKQVDVNWETASESNNDYFAVERSRDGVDFEILTMVKGAGNSNTRLKYSTIDPEPFSGVSYYRLNQVDFDGTNTYSQIQSVEFTDSKAFSFDVYPNPNDGTSMNLIIDGHDNGEVLVVVNDVTGKESYTKVLITGGSEKTVYAIDPANRLAPGMYLITATSKQAIYNKKLIVK